MDQIQNLISYIFVLLANLFAFGLAWDTFTSLHLCLLAILVNNLAAFHSNYYQPSARNQLSLDVRIVTKVLITSLFTTHLFWESEIVRKDDWRIQYAPIFLVVLVAIGQLANGDTLIRCKVNCLWTALNFWAQIVAAKRMGSVCVVLDACFMLMAHICSCHNMVTFGMTRDAQFNYLTGGFCISLSQCK